MTESEQASSPVLTTESDDSQDQEGAKLQELARELQDLAEYGVQEGPDEPSCARFFRASCDSLPDGPAQIMSWGNDSTRDIIECRFMVMWDPEDQVYTCHFSTLRGSDVSIKRSHPEVQGMLEMIMALLEIFPEFDEYQ